MKRFASLLLRWLGFGRLIPATRAARDVLTAERPAAALALIYLALQVFPQLLFTHCATASGITFHSRTPLPAEFASCAARARELLARSELAAPDRPEHVFICNAPWLFTLYGLTSGKSFGFSLPGANRVFIAHADFTTNTARSAAPTYNTRRLSGVVAHEITHGLIRRRLGLRRGISLPEWVAEGYCDYVAQDSSFPAERGLALMSAGQSDPSPSFHYFEYRQMVRHLIEDKHLSFAQLVARSRDAEAVRAETRASLR